MLNAVLSHPEVVDVRLNDIDNVDSYAMVAAFMSANKLIYNIRRSSIPQQSWAPPLSLRDFSPSHPLGGVR